ncbi:hypothetical protein [Anaeromyxobacter paludicola]|uniref:Uncharacterized protein n=1 Tax=Anaeromyxobacter paludicola TaxID=2918171 RepID=A0ABN6N2F3_9BACT|nr:hypothetical protein [Anaeromyxobacter paludicola]BDG07392.1 hypothetical protein AMPC_05050 [Anaeromyxobacter paludicola]
MTKLSGGSQVKGGYYWHLNNWALEPVKADGQTLPGSASDEYLKVNTAAALVLAPMLGAAFVLFMPFIGIYLAVNAAVQPVVRIFKRQAGELAATVTPGWQPGEAHFTGKRAETKVEEKGPPSEVAGQEALEELAKEIESKRQH